MLQLIFSFGLGWLPSSGRVTPGIDTLSDRLLLLILPATMLAAVHAAAWSRYLRAAVTDTWRQPFVVAARARGADERVVLSQHVLRPALLPVVTESVFAWPGLGSLFTESLARRDYTVLMALLMVASTAVIVFNLIADLVYPLIDPRVRA